MPGPDYVIKQHSANIPSDWVLYDATRRVVDLTLATEVRFRVRDAQTHLLLVDHVATVTNAAAGAVRYLWLAADTAAYGDCHGEFRVTYADGSIWYFPSNRYISILIEEDLSQ